MELQRILLRKIQLPHWKVFACLFLFGAEMPLFQKDIIKLGLQLNICLILCHGHIKTLITHFMNYNTVRTCIYPSLYIDTVYIVSQTLNEFL